MSRHILSASLCLLALTGCQSSMKDVSTSFAQADRYNYPAATPAAEPLAAEAAATRQAPGVRVSSRGNAPIVNTGTKTAAAVDGLDASSSELANRVSGKTELYTKDFDMGMSTVETRKMVREFFGDLPYRKYQPRPALPVININEMRTAMAGSQADDAALSSQQAVAAGDREAPAMAPAPTVVPPAPSAVAQAPRLPANPAVSARPATVASTRETYVAPVDVPVTLAPLPPLAEPTSAISG